MARIPLFLCFAFLVASGTLLGVVSPTFLPAIEEPKTLKDVEPYTVNVVMTFAVGLEKECPKTQEFKEFFEKLKAYAKYVCPIAKAIGTKDVKAYESDMKAKGSSLFQAMSALAAGKSGSGGSLTVVLKRDQMEAMKIAISLQSIISKTMNGRDQANGDGSMKLTAEQLKAIKDTITRWEEVITRAVKIVVRGNKSSPELSSVDNRGSNGDSAKAQTQVSPRGSGYVAKGNREDAFKSSSRQIWGGIGASANGNTVDNRGSDGGSTTDATVENRGGNGGDSTKNASVEIQGGVQGSANASTATDARGGNENVTKSNAAETNGNATTSETVVANTSNEVTGFITNLEKKCPETEEFKAFFEKLKAYMKYACPVSSIVGKKNPKAYMSEMTSEAAKLSDAMALVQARMSKSGQTKTTMQSYQQEMMKTLNVLQDVASKVVSESQTKKDGSVTVTETQQKVIKETITKWEQVTTHFVETAVQSETRSSAKTQASSQRSSAESRKTKSWTKTRSSTRRRSNAKNRKIKSFELRRGASTTH